MGVGQGLGRPLVGVEQLAVGLLGNGEVEVKAVLAFNSFLEEPLSVENIQEVEMEEADPLELSNRPGLVGCVIREGDDLWGLAKRYHATVEGIRRLNGLEEDIDILLGDLCRICREGSRISYPRIGAAGPDTQAELLAGAFDVVTSNPPYMKGAHGLQNPGEAKAVSRHEVLCTLEDVCAAAGKLLRSGGRLYMVHRPQRLIEIAEALRKCRLEPKRLQFVHPFSDREANMVLIEAVKDGKSQCRVEKPVIVYQEPGRYTKEIYEIYGY